MKIRAFFLLCLLIGGAYAMYASIEEFQVKAFHDILPGPANSVEQLVFTRPAPASAAPPAWTVTDKEEIGRLLAFLRTVEVKKVDAETDLHTIDFNQFTLSLQDEEQNHITILTEDQLVVNGSGEQFAVVGGSLDMEWILQFMLANSPDGR